MSRRWLLLVAALVVAPLAVAAVWSGGATPTSHAGSVSWAAVLELAAGLGLVLAGGLRLFVQGRATTGGLVMVAGIAWLAGAVTAWGEGPLWVRSLAMVVAPFVGSTLAHLAAVFPHEGTRRLVLRAFVAASYVGTAAASLLWALFRDPFRMRSCWENCTGNSLLVHWDRDLTEVVTAGWRWLVLLMGAGVVVVALGRLVSSTPSGRRVTAVVLVPLAGAGLAQAAYAVALLLSSPESAREPLFTVLFVARATTLLLVAAGVSVTTARELRRRRDAARLADLVGAAPAPGTLRATLAETFGDEDLQVGYWIPDQDSYLDVDGSPLEIRQGAGRAVTPIVRHGSSVAVVVHDESLVTSRDLTSEVGAAARLAVDNERLLAQEALQLNQLRVSRRRLVQTADGIRRRLERNLHDGAQQRLLSLAYVLRLGATAAAERGDDRLLAAFEAATDEAAAALAEVRELAQGIFPMILGEAGLGPALATFADSAPLALDVGDLPGSRFDNELEAALFAAITDTCRSSAEQSGRAVRLSWWTVDHLLGVGIESDVPLPAGELVNATDRVGAVGGTLDVEGCRVLVRVPCAS